MKYTSISENSYILQNSSLYAMIIITVLLLNPNKLVPQ